MAERDLVVRFIGDDRDLQRAFTNTERGAKRVETRTAAVGRNLSRGFAAAGLTLGAGAGLAAANRFAQAASNLNEEVSKSEKVFGDSADAVRAWSETTASSFGVSQTAALAATGTFGNLFRVVDIGQKPAADMSRTLVELAADLASFNNANIDDVLLAIRSGLIGEAEPLRRYGVLLSETRVQQEAMAESGKKNVKELTNQEKALARYRIILKDTVPAQGDFADTAGELANQQRIAAAEAQELSVNIGQALAPALQIATIATIGLVGGLNDLIDGLRRVRTQLRETDVFDSWNEGVESAAQSTQGFFERIRDGIPFMEQFLALRDRVIDFQGDNAPVTGGGLLAGARTRAGGLPSAADTADREAKEAQQRLAQSRRRFGEFTKGLGLKLKSAGITDALSDDIAVLEEIERAILRQIQIEGRTFKLADQLADVRLQIARTMAQQAGQVERAEQERADAEEAAAEKREERQRRQRERARAGVRAGQFEALGLSGEGAERVPGVAALRRRARSLLRQIEGTPLDTERNQRRIGAVLSEQFKNAGREVRQAILSMFNEISAALNQGTKAHQGRLTKFRVANFSNIADQFPGMSQEEQRKLQQILSRIGAGGTTPRPSGAGGAFGFEPSGGNVIINGPITVVADNTNEFQRELERRKRRGSGSRTGPRVRTQGGV